MGWVGDDVRWWDFANCSNEAEKRSKAERDGDFDNDTDLQKKPLNLTFQKIFVFHDLNKNALPKNMAKKGHLIKIEQSKHCKNQSETYPYPEKNILKKTRAVLEPPGNLFIPASVGAFIKNEHFLQDTTLSFNILEPFKLLNTIEILNKTIKQNTISKGMSPWKMYIIFPPNALLRARRLSRLFVAVATGTVSPLNQEDAAMVSRWPILPPHQVPTPSLSFSLLHPSPPVLLRFTSTQLKCRTPWNTRSRHDPPKQSTSANCEDFMKIDTTNPLDCIISVSLSFASHWQNLFNLWTPRKWQTTMEHRLKTWARFLLAAACRPSILPSTHPFFFPPSIPSVPLFLRPLLPFAQATAKTKSENIYVVSPQGVSPTHLRTCSSKMCGSWGRSRQGSRQTIKTWYNYNYTP